MGRKTVSKADNLLELESVLHSAADPAVAQAKASLLASKRRHRHFGALVASAQSWEMLLCLYILDAREVCPMVSRLVEMGGGSMTTALRVLGRFETAGFIVRQQIPEDGRVVTVVLTAKAKKLLSRYFRDLADAE